MSSSIISEALKEYDSNVDYIDIILMILANKESDSKEAEDNGS